MHEISPCLVYLREQLVLRRQLSVLQENIVNILVRVVAVIKVRTQLNVG